MLKLRVVHCGTGISGKEALRGILANPRLELVGMRVYDPVKVGQDAGTLAGASPCGIKASDDLQALLALRPDCFSYFGDPFTHAQPGIADVTRFLAQGCNVVTPTFMPLLHPVSAPAELRDAVERACAAGQSTFYCSGIEPGFVDCQLATDLLSMTNEVSEIRVQEIGNYSKDANEFAMREVFGFGSPLDKPGLLQTTDIGRFFWGACVNQLGEALGKMPERIDIDCEVAAFDRDIETRTGLVPAGTTAAMRFAMTGVVDGKPLVLVEHILRMHADAAPQWDKAHGIQGGAPFHQHRVIITGRPSFTCAIDTGEGDATINPGFAMVGMRLVNSIPSVVAAAPGILGQLQIRRYCGRNSP